MLPGDNRGLQAATRAELRRVRLSLSGRLVIANLVLAITAALPLGSLPMRSTSKPTRHPPGATATRAQPAWRPVSFDAIRAALAPKLERLVATTPVFDIHTHLYDPAFSDLLLWGIDDLLVYHYLTAETLRQTDLPSSRFWSLPKVRQADLIWDQLFIKHSPVSEACRGVLTTLNALGLDVRKRDLPALRRWFATQDVNTHIDRCLALAGVERLCMTNSPFDDLERPVWERGFPRDPRFLAALRVDPLVVGWPEAAARLSAWGYRVGRTLSARTVDEIRRFLTAWTQRIDARYLMVSLPPDFTAPARTEASQMIERVVLPHCRERGLPLALMLGVKRAVNPELRLAGDGVGRSDLRALEYLCAAYPQNKFLVTVLSRENQHELCVLARKFRNLHVFGCWWFTNVPSLIEEVTRLRLELLGLSFTPQHSDARVLDQLIYKWTHFRRVLVRALTDQYAGLCATGWEPTAEELLRDVSDLLGGAFVSFCRS